MSKRRISNSERTTNRSRKPSRRPVEKKQSDLKLHRFVGVSLSGGKNSRTCVSVLDYYPEHNKLVLNKIIQQIESQNEMSADELLVQTLSQMGETLRYVAFDAPLSLPKCITCRLECPGVVNCKEPHVEWFWQYYRKIKKQKKNTKLFTPYTQRPVEAYLTTELEEPFHPSDALGANTAPLTARLMYLMKHLKHIDVIEAFPKLTVWRVGKSLKLPKRVMRFHKHSVEGDKSRLQILTKLSEEGRLFIYQQDMNALVTNGHAFDSLMCALTAFYKHRNLTEPRPEGFPINETWIEFPSF